MQGKRACRAGGAGLPACVTGGTGAAGGAVRACGRGLASRCPGTSHGRKNCNTQDGGGPRWWRGKPPENCYKVISDQLAVNDVIRHVLKVIRHVLTKISTNRL
jgi:hypothetical protein